MLFLCLLMFALIFARPSVDGIQLTYIVRKEGQRLLPICVGEGEDRYEGISWTYPLLGDGVLPQEDHSYLPSITNSYNCKFSKNEPCSRTWSMKNWEIDNNTTKRFDFISDERWEDFPTYYVSNDTKEFEEKIEIPQVFNLGFSVRASDAIEIYVCEGWDPKKYSCYHFNITSKEIQARKLSTMSENDVNNGSILESYKAYSNIISKDEWRNFEMSMDENHNIKLKDLKLNRSLIEKKDEHPLKPAYFYFKSKKPSLWKIHQNEFFYTRTSQKSRLGPSFRLDTKDLCINLYLSSCENCTTTFFMVENGTMVIIAQKELRRSGKWSLIRLTKEEVSPNYMNLFIKTSFKEGADRINGFWAIDNVRVCHRNEVRISTLKKVRGLTADDTEVTCQILEKPNLRPKKRLMNSLKDFPTMEVESDSKSINITWNQETKEGFDYFVNYQGNDICVDHQGSTRRTKSNGFLVTKSNSVYLKDLIPYTAYNVTISSMLHLEAKRITVSTKDSSYIDLKESPSSVRVEDETDSTAKVTWNKVDCKDMNGRIIYTLTLTDDKSQNVTDLGAQTENYKVLKGLRPLSNYTLTIWTSRDVVKQKENRWNFVTRMHFSTKPGLAPPPRNLEVYATSSSSIFLRYDLPDESIGHPIEVHITRCNPLTLKKCKTSLKPVSPCKMFTGKYCLDIENMIPHLKQILRISLKNEGSHTFGNESVIEAYTEERMPGKPTNLTYSLVDCSSTTELCNLNLSWLHPYNQNGSISAFNIVLNGTGGKDFFNEEVKIINQNYSSKYSHQIKKIPFGQSYNLYIRSVNDEHQGQFTTPIVVEAANLGDNIDQSPVLVETLEDSLKFELKPVDRRMSTTFTIIVQDFDETKEIDETMAKQEILDNLCNEYGDSWISQIVKVNDEKKKIIVGKSDSSGRSLKPSTEYCITFFVENVYKNATNTNTYFEKLTTPAHKEPPHVEPPSSSKPHLFIKVVIVVIALILIGFLIVWYFRKRRTSRNSRTNHMNMEEHAYETLPFEDTTANNNMYDHLEHK